MGGEHSSQQQQRRFLRLDVTEDVRALDAAGRDIGRVEKVGAGGLQVRMSPTVDIHQYTPGSRMQIKIVEPGNVEQTFHVEVRVCDGSLLGLQFLN